MCLEKCMTSNCMHLWCTTSGNNRWPLLVRLQLSGGYIGQSSKDHPVHLCCNKIGVLRTCACTFNPPPPPHSLQGYSMRRRWAFRLTPTLSTLARCAVSLWTQPITISTSPPQPIVWLCWWGAHNCVQVPCMSWLSLIPKLLCVCLGTRQVLMVHDMIMCILQMCIHEFELLRYWG